MDRSYRAEAALYLCGAGLPHRDFRRPCRLSARRRISFPISTFLSSASCGPITGCCPTICPSRVIYYYERNMTAQVGDIAHIESQSLAQLRRGQDLLSEERQYFGRARASDRRLANGAQTPATRHHAALCAELQRLQRSDPAIALSSKKLPQMQLFDLGQNFIRPQLATVAARRCPRPMAAKFCRCRSISISRRCKRTASRRTMWSMPISVQNLTLPAGDQKIGKFDWNVRSTRAPIADRDHQRPAGEESQRHDHLRARCRLRASGLAAADQHRAGERFARGADDDPQGRSGVDAATSSTASNRCCRGLRKVCHPA